jgi:hypothetical protein
MNDERRPKAPHESATTDPMITVPTDIARPITGETAGFIAGYELGLATRRDTDRREADHEARHALVRPIILAMVSDMNRIMVLDLDGRAQLRRARQVEACKDYKAKARPWPDETTGETRQSAASLRWSMSVVRS